MMLFGFTYRVVVTVATLSIAGGALAACSTPSEMSAADYSDVSLLDSKLSAQLLRNTAADHLSSAELGVIVETEDASIACLSEADDPDGAIRAWKSTLIVAIAGEGDAAAASVADLIDSFADEGWDSSSLGLEAPATGALLTNEASPAEIKLVGREPTGTATATDEVFDQATVEVQVLGPCAKTLGARSSEVAELEGH